MWACGLGLANRKLLSRARIVEATLRRCKGNVETFPSLGGIESSASVVAGAVSGSDRAFLGFPGPLFGHFLNTAWCLPSSQVPVPCPQSPGVESGSKLIQRTPTFLGPTTDSGDELNILKFKNQRSDRCCTVAGGFFFCKGLEQMFEALGVLIATTHLCHSRARVATHNTLASELCSNQLYGP